jgi:hypothetical protein
MAMDTRPVPPPRTRTTGVRPRRPAHHAFNLVEQGGSVYVRLRTLRVRIMARKRARPVSRPPAGLTT